MMNKKPLVLRGAILIREDKDKGKDKGTKITEVKQETTDDE